ncbi:MAG: hypothetical protein ACH346_06335 [Chthoniobacterales bacterium]
MLRLFHRKKKEDQAQKESIKSSSRPPQIPNSTDITTSPPISGVSENLFSHSTGDCEELPHASCFAAAEVKSLSEEEEVEVAPSTSTRDLNDREAISAPSAPSSSSVEATLKTDSENMMPSILAEVIMSSPSESPAILPPPLPQLPSDALKQKKKINFQIPKFKAYITSIKAFLAEQNFNREQLKTIFFASLKFFSKQWSSLQKPSSNSDQLILRPGETAGTWQLWKIATADKVTQSDSKSLPELIDDHAAPFSPSNKTRLIIGMPTRDLMVIPLWISSEGNLLELVEMELASKHLLRRDMAEGLKTIPLETKNGRMLVIVLAPSVKPTAATAPYLKEADQFEAAARFFSHQGKDLLIWQELGEICFGFLKNGHCIWFSGSGETLVNRTLIGLITRMALRLQSESVIEGIPQSLRLIGNFSEEERSLLKEAFAGKDQTESVFEYHETLTPPLIPGPPIDLPPQQARLERIEQEKQQRIKKFAAAAFAVYLFLLFLGLINLIVKESILKHLDHQAAAQKTSVAKATQNIACYQELRSSIDSTTYPLDILTTIASQIHGEKIRLISLIGAEGRLQITGEATDVSQAYAFIELIKKAPELQEYAWTSGQPKLAGKNSVRFELEGAQAHAKSKEE